MRLIHLLLGLPLIAASVAGIGVGCGDRNAEVTTSGPSTSGSSTESGNSSSGAGGASAGCYAGLKSIALTPADSTVKLDGKAAAPLTFNAEGTFGSGTMTIRMSP